MKKISVGDSRYQLVAIEGEGLWTAHAESEDAGQRFGVECEGMTEDQAIDRLTQWLEWQEEHSAALEALQAAERAYFRAIAGSAFAKRPEGLTPFDSPKDCLDAVDAARVTLDEIRTRKPDC